MGSVHPVELKVREYENPLVFEQADQPPMVEMEFQLALDPEGKNVVVVPDQAMIEEGTQRFNPFQHIKAGLEERGRVACVERIHVHQMKNTSNVQLTVRVDRLFSMPADHAFVSGCPDGQVLDAENPHTDDTNVMVFSVGARCNRFIPTGIRVYSKRVGDGEYRKWAGMDAAFEPPPKRQVEEDIDIDTGEVSTTVLPVPTCEVLPDPHAMVRAIRMYIPSAEKQWKTTLNTKQVLIHSIPCAQTDEIRRLMNNTFFAKRRYTTFHETGVSLVIDNGIQQQLNEAWLERLREPTCPRPVIQVIVSVSMLTFGKGDPIMNVVQLTLE